MRLQKIISVKRIGTRPVRDIEVDHPDHNFFANGVVVSNSHSYCYAYVGYVCMWLKVNFKLEWWNSVLQNSNHDDLKEAARHVHDIVIPPDINRSSLDFYVIREEVAKLMFPLNRIKNVKGAGAFITEAREQVLLDPEGCEFRPGPFTSIEDFYGRINRTKINKRVVASLIWAGAFDDLYGIKPDSIVKRNDIYLAYLLVKKDKTLGTYVKMTENEVVRIQMELLAIGTIDVVTMIRNKTGIKQICATADVLKWRRKCRRETSREVILFGWAESPLPSGSSRPRLEKTQARKWLLWIWKTMAPPLALQFFQTPMLLSREKSLRGTFYTLKES